MFYNLVQNLTALKMWRWCAGHKTRSNFQLIAVVGLENRKNNFPSSFRARATARGDARALAKNPKLLLATSRPGELDTPTSKSI
jgi:ABC-type ATPase involved in cell division